MPRPSGTKTAAGASRPTRKPLKGKSRPRQKSRMLRGQFAEKIETMMFARRSIRRGFPLVRNRSPGAMARTKKAVRTSCSKPLRSVPRSISALPPGGQRLSRRTLSILAEDLDIQCLSRTAQGSFRLGAPTVPAGGGFAFRPEAREPSDKWDV